MRKPVEWVGIGLLLATMNVYFRDMSHWVEAGLRIGMFVTPVFYPASAYPREFVLLLYPNPMAQFVGIFQALLLAHGGITTLGANAVSMAIVGSFAAWGIYKGLKRAGSPMWLAVFVATALSDLITYCVTAFQLAWAFPDPVSGFVGSLTKFMGIFAVTQIPLAISEGLLTVLIMTYLVKYNRSELDEMGVLRVQREAA